MSLGFFVIILIGKNRYYLKKSIIYLFFKLIF